MCQRLGATQTVAVLDATGLQAQCLDGRQSGQQQQDLLDGGVQVVVVES